MSRPSDALAARQATNRAFTGLLLGLAGIAVTGGYAATRSWRLVVPPWVTGGGMAATLLIGMIAGLYPAIRAARPSPTAALATT